jgi:hypothetical protein
MMIDYDRDNNDDEMTMLIIIRMMLILIKNMMEMMRMTMIVHISMIEYTNASKSITLIVIYSYVYHTNDDNW